MMWQSSGGKHVSKGITWKMVGLAATAGTALIIWTNLPPASKQVASLPSSNASAQPAPSEMDIAMQPARRMLHFIHGFSAGTLKGEDLYHWQEYMGDDTPRLADDAIASLQPVLIKGTDAEKAEAKEAVKELTARKLDCLKTLKEADQRDARNARLVEKRAARERAAGEAADREAHTIHFKTHIETETHIEIQPAN